MQILEITDHFRLPSRFDWQVPEDKLKDRKLDITVKNDVSFFSKSKTSMGQVRNNI